MAKYLDKSGVTYLWNKIKGLFTDQSLNTKNKTYAGAINEINTKVGNLTGAFLWKGKFDTLPAVTNYEAGNVVGVGNKEYVLTVTKGTKTWEEFGDEGSYLLKTAAEETYLKKAAGEVKTANLADNAVTSTKLAMGARKPIILTPDITEVDEETYQKLLSDDVDVVYNTINMTTKDIDSDKNITMTFSYAISTADIIQISSIDIQISSTSPHLVVKGDPAEQIISPEQVVNKSTLSPVLQEIDLTGTDADRKAKLDQFEVDWKALTGASNLTGARFVGYLYDSNQKLTDGFGVFTFDVTNNGYSSICSNVNYEMPTLIIVSCEDGSLTITPLFSHLEAVTIYTDNTPEHRQANLDNIAAYKANLEALGVDTTKGWNAPVKVNVYNRINPGIFASTEENTDAPYTVISGVSGGYPFIIPIDKTSGRATMWEMLCAGRNYASITTTAKDIISAINEVNALAKSKQDALTSGTNIKTINGQSLLGSGDIAISGGGDVTAAGDNTFTGNNVFSGIAIADILDGTQYQITGDNGVLMFTSGATNEDIQLSGVATPTYSNSAANKSYVDTQINTALGTVLTQLQNI